MVPFTTTSSYLVFTYDALESRYRLYISTDARAGGSYCFAFLDCEKHAYFHYLRDYFGYKLLCMILEFYIPCILDQFFLYYTNKCTPLTFAYNIPRRSFYLPKHAWRVCIYIYTYIYIYIYIIEPTRCTFHFYQKLNQKVHLIGSIIYFIMMHGQYNIKCLE